VPQRHPYPNFWNLLHARTLSEKSKEILHGDEKNEKKISFVNKYHYYFAWPKIFVTQMLTRDLSAVANLLFLASCLLSPSLPYLLS